MIELTELFSFCAKGHTREPGRGFNDNLAVAGPSALVQPLDSEQSYVTDIQSYSTPTRQAGDPPSPRVAASERPALGPFTHLLDLDLATLVHKLVELAALSVGHALAGSHRACVLGRRWRGVVGEGELVNTYITKEIVCVIWTCRSAARARHFLLPKEGVKGKPGGSWQVLVP
jgi:hypothetical protein